MDRADLIRSAGDIPQASRRAADLFGLSARLLAEKMDDAMLAREDLTELIGEGNLDLMVNNHWNLTCFMESMSYGFDAELFVDTVVWALATYLARGFRSEYWRACLPEWRRAGRELLGDKFSEAEHPFLWMEEHLDDFLNLREVRLKACRTDR
jgi:hypothetical protein